MPVLSYQHSEQPKARMTRWTPDSLRPPTPGDAPFYAADFGIVVTGDGVVHPLPKITPYLGRIAREFPELPLHQELERLCQSFNEEALSALNGALRETVSGHVARGRRKRAGADNRARGIAGAATLSPVTTKQFDTPRSSSRTYPCGMSWAGCAGRSPPGRLPRLRTPSAQRSRAT